VSSRACALKKRKAEMEDIFLMQKKKRMHPDFNLSGAEQLSKRLP
jgi:hypothetical protein